MDGKTHSYLDLVAQPAVGAALLDGRPALVFSDDGGRVLWANVAGASLFGETRIDALLDRPVSQLNPIRAQAGRLARLLPSDTARMEILRIGLGVRMLALPAACRRLNLPDDERAVLAVATTAGSGESITTRAEKLAVAIAGRDCLAAVLGADGKVVAASDGFDALTPVRDAIADLIASAAGDRTRPASGSVTVAGSQRLAGAAGFDADGRDLFLVIVGPEPETQPAVVVSPEPRAAEPASSVDIVAPPAAAEPAPPARAVVAAKAAALRPVARFTWATDADSRFTMASAGLAAAVGGDNAAIIGKGWQAVAEQLNLDPDGRVAENLAGHRAWSATVCWPVAGEVETIAVDLTAMPARSPDGAPAGFHGFGLCRTDARQPDTRPMRTTLAERGADTAAPAAPPEAGPPEPPADAANVPERPAPPATGHGQDLDDAARKSIEEGRRPASQREPLKLVPPAEPVKQSDGEAEAGTNIVRLPGAAAPSNEEHLSGSEKDAFQRIAEALGARTAEGRQRTPEGTHVERRRADRRKDIATAPPTGIDSRLLDRVPIGLVVFRDHKTLFANRTLLELLGYGSFDAFIEAGGVEAIFPGDESSWAGHDLADSDLAAERADGELVPVTARLNAVTWDGATALMLAIRARQPDDLEDDSGSSTAARERVAVLESILDTATDGVIVIDSAGRIGSMNRSAEALFGVEQEDFAARSFTDLLAEESHKAALDYLDGLASNGVASILNDGREVIGKVPQGGLIPLFMTMGRLGEADKFCAVLRDMSHWKNVESELVAARRAAEAASAQKSDFLAKVSHEIRTPLNAIIGFSEVMMEERFGPIGNDRYSAYMRDIHVSGTHLMSLINDLLDLSKIEAGKLDLAFEAVSVNSIVQECVALMQPQANRQRIIIRTSLSEAVPNVVADQRSIRQILLNLLSNAIKFTKPGGQVIASTTLEDNGEVELRIRDTGVGMSEADIETALKPFRQIVTSDRNRGEGTGLGLPLTKALVEANRASFAIDSVVDQGTLIRVTFPTTRVLAG